MPDHVHFIIQPAGNSNLPDIMRWILSVFAKRYNKANKLKGHLFMDRYKSKIIEDLLQYLNTFHYISNNPVKANLVNEPSLYEFSGLYYIQNKIYDIVEPFQLKLNL